MSFKIYKFGSYKKEIRNLLRERLKIKDRMRYHKLKINYHEDKIRILKEESLVEVEKKLNVYLERAGN